MKRLAVLAIVAVLSQSNAAADRVNELQRQRTTMAVIHAIAVALESYRIDHQAYPVRDRTSADALCNTLVPDYLKSCDVLDAWGRPLRLASSGVSFVIWSSGLDGEEEKEPKGGAQASADADVIYTQQADDFGYFWQGPPGQDRVGDGSCARNPVHRVNAELQSLEALGVKSGG